MTKEGFVGANFVLTARMATNRKMWSDENFGRDNEKRRVILDELSRTCCSSMLVHNLFDNMVASLLRYVSASLSKIAYMSL